MRSQSAETGTTRPAGDASEPGSASAPPVTSAEVGGESSVQGMERSRLAFLARSSRCLAESLDYESTLATVASLALPFLGSWCVVDVVEPDETMRRIAIVHPDPEKQELVAGRATAGLRTARTRSALPRRCAPGRSR